jgi:hypothetical protein
MLAAEAHIYEQPTGDYEKATNRIGKFTVCCGVHFHGVGAWFERQ